MARRKGLVIVGGQYRITNAGAQRTKKKTGACNYYINHIIHTFIQGHYNQVTQFQMVRYEQKMLISNRL